MCAPEMRPPRSLRRSPPNRFIASRWASFVGPSGRNSGGRPIQPALLGRARIRAQSHETIYLVEVCFAIIERQALRRGDFASVQELMAAIRRFCDGWNQRCRPFTWTKDADQILAKR